MARNQLIDMATASLSDLIKKRPEQQTKVRQDLQFLNAQKLGEHEAEIKKIKNVFLAILRDIKKNIDSGEQPGETATTAILQSIQELLKEKEKSGING